MRRIAAAACVLALALLRTTAGAQGEDLLFDAVDDPVIGYSTAPRHDRVAALSQQLAAGTARLAHEPGSGYLRSLLGALNVPIESQMAVFSKTSLQSAIIAPANPRTIFFADDVAVAWPRGGFIEIAAHDPRQGVQFYILDQRESAAPQIVHPNAGTCLNCHLAYATQGVPGLLVKSVATDAAGRLQPQLGNYLTDDRSPLVERWAGWYVTGSNAAANHLGHAVGSLAEAFDSKGYLSPYSDVAALLVFDHQARVVNLLTRAGWDARLAPPAERDAIVRRDAIDLVDALLFVDEAPLPAGLGSSAGFAQAFAARGPVDRNGRSLRQLDLRARLMRYPCSYMIYTPAFDALPDPVRTATYQRLWDVLSGGETGRRYARLTAADRRAIVEILRDTKPGLPPYFK
jgi:hypothetical protein